jgi:VanZ family protein
LRAAFAGIMARMGDDDPLRFQRLWHAVGFLLVALVIYLSLTPELPALARAPGDKVGHVLAYATLMLWFAQLHSRVRARIALALAFVALGVGLEFAQRLTDYRSFDMQDMFADALGVALGWIGAPPRSAHLLRFVERRMARA